MVGLCLFTPKSVACGESARSSTLLTTASQARHLHGLRLTLKAHARPWDCLVTIILSGRGPTHPAGGDPARPKRRARYFSDLEKIRLRLFPDLHALVRSRRSRSFPLVLARSLAFLACPTKPHGVSDDVAKSWFLTPSGIATIPSGSWRRAFRYKI